MSSGWPERGSVPPGRRSPGRRFSSSQLTIGRIDLARDQVQAARAGQLQSDAFLSDQVNEPFAYYVEPDIRLLRAKLPAHFMALNDYIGESGGTCAIVRDERGNEVGVMSWIHPAAAAAVSAAAGEEATARYEKRVIDLWGSDAASRYWDGCNSMQTVADAAAALPGEHTICIVLCVVASHLFGQGGGSAMLQRFLADRAIVQDATHVMASTETTSFWKKIGMNQVGPDIHVPSQGQSRGFCWRVYKGKVNSVAQRLGELAGLPPGPPGP
jgi:hypothetical protein